jgi:hypothetical protein
MGKNLKKYILFIFKLLSLLIFMIYLTIRLTENISSNI